MQETFICVNDIGALVIFVLTVYYVFFTISYVLRQGLLISLATYGHYSVRRIFIIVISRLIASVLIHVYQTACY